MNDKARIALAEAMGWKPGWIGGQAAKRRGKVSDIWSPPEREYSCWYNSDELPDPFTDANDDYQVLLWMRNTCGPTNSQNWDDAQDIESWMIFVDKLRISHWYQIGDYARAACSVLNIEIEDEI